MNQITNNDLQLIKQEVLRRHLERLERVNTALRRRLDAAIRKIAADNDAQKLMYEELRASRKLRRIYEDLQQQLDETRRHWRHYRRQLFERERELGEVKSALGIILRELLAARESSQALRQALPDDFSEPDSLAAAIRTLCEIAASKS